MEKNSIPSVRKGEGRSKIKKMITFFTCVVLIFVSTFIFTFGNYVYGYKYYTTFEGNQILIGQVNNNNLLTETIQQEMAKLENNNYYIISVELDPEILIAPKIIHKSNLNEQELIDNIKKCLNIEVLLTKLTIKGEKNNYYFKTEEECNIFINELNKILKVETKIEGTIGDYKQVSTQQELKDLKNKYSKKVQEKKQYNKKKITNRSGQNRTSNIQCNVLESYVCISSKYGPRWGSMHTGVDFAAYSGTKIYSWKSGKVTFAGWSGGYGNFIEVSHDDGTISRYAHCSKLNVSLGQIVKKGQTIGYVGSTGNSTGPHLHFEIKVNGNFVNPLSYL